MLLFLQKIQGRDSEGGLYFLIDVHCLIDEGLPFFSLYPGVDFGLYGSQAI